MQITSIKSRARQSLLPLLVGLLVGALAARFAFPSKTELRQRDVVTKEKIVYKDRITTKSRTETRKPDGTTVVVETDKVAESDKTSELDKKLMDRVKLTTPPQNLNYEIYGLVGTSLRSLGQPSYGISLGRRLVGPIWINAFVMSDLSGGVGIGFKF
jgi:hypothetical protein